ncbi:MAG: citrate synthase/methylcitrate synthase [Steroidobacteraceae bacterium]
MDSRPGLDGVVATDTVLSDVDGEAGRLVIRGYPLQELVGRRRFEEVLELLLAGFFDAPAMPLARALGAARARAFAFVPHSDHRLLELTPIEGLRALMARLPDADDHAAAMLLIAAPAVFTAALVRLRDGLAPLEPDATLEHAADALRMLRGSAAARCEVDALDKYLVTVADHGLNASTFTARIVASTQAGLTSATVAALSALKGPLHGGAPGPVLDMLDDIGRPEHAHAWLERALSRGERLMGFGHRIYRVRDPRADALRDALQVLHAARGTPDERLLLAEAVERTAVALLRRDKPQRRLDTNVEFYTALLLEALAVPRSSFTCVFAMGRVGGWIAHAREQVLHGRLIRPQSRYVGPAAPPQAA